MAQGDCKDPGVLVPLINRNKCEGKEDCVRVCPYHVFEMRTLTAEDKLPMSFLGKLKARAHGNRQAFVKAPQDCHACGLCVTACPEKAITLGKP